MKPHLLQRFERIKEAKRNAFCRQFSKESATNLRRELDKALSRRGAHD